MGKIKKYIAWILLIIVLIVGFIVGRSIWFSLKDTRAKLKEQKEKMEELVKKDASMRAYMDSLDQVLLELKAEEERLASERERLSKRLAELQKKYSETIAKIDTLWTASGIINELEAAFPHWKGQFWAAIRGDGVHGLIAPQFFGAEVVEIKADLDNRIQQLVIKDSTIANLDSTIFIKDRRIEALTLKADSLKASYENVWSEYKILDKKYTDLLKRKWFTLHLDPGNIISAGVGFGAGYAVGGLKK
jgi:predicted transcriptional regulator